MTTDTLSPASTISPAAAAPSPAPQRFQGLTCATCAWFASGTDGRTRCYQRPPVIVTHWSGRGTVSERPDVDRTDGCHDHSELERRRLEAMRPAPPAGMDPGLYPVGSQPTQHFVTGLTHDRNPAPAQSSAVDEVLHGNGLSSFAGAPATTVDFSPEHLTAIGRRLAASSKDGVSMREIFLQIFSPNSWGKSEEMRAAKVLTDEGWTKRQSIRRDDRAPRWSPPAS